MTGGSAAVVWDASYRPFGEATIAGAAANDQRFPGQTADAETGYSDNWHRTYDPSLGRYLQSDPIGLAGGWNTYGYVGGNPVMRVDPRGLRYAGPAALITTVAVAVRYVAMSMPVLAGAAYLLSCPNATPIITWPTWWPSSSSDDESSKKRGKGDNGGPPMDDDGGPKLPVPPPPPIWPDWPFFDGSPALKDDPYHPDNVEARQEDWNDLYGPSETEFWDGLQNFRDGIRTNGEKGKKRRYYEWDYTHNDVEVYNGRGDHLGSADPGTGEVTKPPVKGRDIRNSLK